jgi:hypothetical protein
LIDTEIVVKGKGHNPKLYFGDENAWRKMLEETKPDAVFIATPWETTAPGGRRDEGRRARLRRNPDRPHHRGNVGHRGHLRKPPAATAC